MSEKNFYLTTAIDYVNGVPHIGHAYEKIMTDVIAKHYSQRQDNIYFLSGTDEHGIKIQKTAASLGITPQELCDKNSKAFTDAWALLGINYNDFIRTSSDSHKKAVQKIFKKLVEKGDIYKHSYTGLYCSGCECFLTSKDLDENGCCLIHGKKPDEVQEENYFFKLTKYKDIIADHIKNNPDFILPHFRANEVLNQLENIEDISVSRSKSSVTWGIDVLDDAQQVIYVWIDALSNYITALGYDTEKPAALFEKNWPADVQVIGKDILKFHSIYWPAILLALDLPLPKHLLAHGWITIDQSKMSKSLGNVIAPKDIINEYNLDKPDAFRYFLATAAQYGKDGNFSDVEFKEKVNADLANNIGNLLNRTLNMLVKYFNGEIREDFKIVGNDDLSNQVKEISKNAQEMIENIKNRFDTFQIAEASVEIVKFADKVNKFVNDTAPWSLAKDEKMDECAKVLYTVLEAMHFIAVAIYPFCPNISADINNQLSLIDSSVKFVDLAWGNIPNGIITEKSKIKPVFLRLDSELAKDKKKGY